MCLVNVFFKLLGLLKTESPDARQMALTIARRYTDGAIFSCPDGAEVCNMFEKYNVNDTGAAGGGGKYKPKFLISDKVKCIPGDDRA